MIDAKAWGIEPGYWDHRGNWEELAPATRDKLLAAMEADGERPPESPVVVAAKGDPVDLTPVTEIRLEDGGTEATRNRLPPDLPFGYHRLVDQDGAEKPLIYSPGACFLPGGLRIWGWAVQLYATRSRHSWGMGDLADLRDIASWARRQQAGMLMLNPLHAVNPGGQQASPYFPGSRTFRNPLYLRIESVPGADEAEACLEPMATQGRALTAAAHIDRDAIYRLKMKALQLLWERWPGSTAFDEYQAFYGAVLENFATFMSLAEAHGEGPYAWPAEYRDPRGRAVQRWRDENRNRVAFHSWIQWLLDEQLREAAKEMPLVHDLAVGIDAGGADAWLWNEAFASGMSTGAPPDEFSAAGQNWGFPPFDPWKLRAAGYEPFIQTVRGGFRHAAGLRIDHVMGLFRLFWVPEGEPATRGAYVRYPQSDLLNILALESHRAGAYVVGEDLGTVEPVVREEMGARNMLSYRIMWFEEDPPEAYPELALAAVTNHDLPTVAGMWTGSDLREQEELGLNPDAGATRALRGRLQNRLHLGDDAPVQEVIEAAYGLLATAPSALVVATLEDALGAEQRPNIPGTGVEQRPNWSIPLPLPLEELMKDPRPKKIAEIMSARDQSA